MYSIQSDKFAKQQLRDAYVKRTPVAGGAGTHMCVPVEKFEVFVSVFLDNDMVAKWLRTYAGGARRQ